MHRTLPPKVQDLDPPWERHHQTNDSVSFKTFWENAVQIVALTAVPAIQHGYDMATTNKNASAHSLTNAVSNFGMTYAATQESL
jgi:hypothetical protein